MKINSLTYKDNAENWELAKLDFFNLTLLVGISGVGKTQILKSILKIKEIASGKSLNGVKWDISFATLSGVYRWKGEFETLDYKNPITLFDNEDKIKPKILNEIIYLNEEKITEREENKIEFKGVKMPKLSSEESIISIFKEEDSIIEAYEGFAKMIFRDHTIKEGLRLGEQEKVIEKYKTLEDIQNSNLDTFEKLQCLYANQRVVFKEIVENYKDIFPQIVDVKIESIIDNRMPRFMSNIPLIQFKENKVDTWILFNRMSSGMLRTFLHISEMYLLKAGTVVLIDEFENSLGVNCIDVLTEDLLFENNRLQFIATSHHPYIINKIPYEHWKIVTRSGGEIKTFDAKDFDLGASKHERFINLINLPQYKKGIQSIG